MSTITKPNEVQVISKPSASSRGLAITQDVRMRLAQAETFARYNLAMMTQRDWTAVEAMLLKDCDNPDFAREAYYKKPAGGGKDIEGLSIRFAERAVQHMRNISVDVAPEMEDEYSVHYRMTVIDLESNTPTSETFKVEKTVERRHVKDGDTVISQRTNSSGDTTYLIPATEDQLNTKLRAQSAKVKRTLINALVPADIRQRCLDRCKHVATSTDAKDPAAATKGIVAAFIGIGVDVPDLKEYLGKAPASATPKQVEELRSVFALIRDGEMTWGDALEAKRESEAAKGSRAEFVAAKQKEREKAKAQRQTKPEATQGASRRGRRPAAETTSPDPGAEARADTTHQAAGDSAKTETTTTATQPKPRASRRGDDEDKGDGDASTDPASNSATA